MLIVSMNLSAVTPESKQETPSLEFLEYLGQFENERGEYIDPLSLDDGKHLQSDSQKQNRHKKQNVQNKDTQSIAQDESMEKPDE